MDIYSGTIKNWKDVGGRNKAIQAFQRPEDSGSQNMMDKLVMKGKKMADAPRDYVVSEMGELLEEVSSYDEMCIRDRYRIECVQPLMISEIRAL